MRIERLDIGRILGMTCYLLSMIFILSIILR
jgi:hypothetical protein